MNERTFDHEWNELHERGAALPEIFVFSLVRAYFFWFEGSSLAQTSGTGIVRFLGGWACLELEKFLDPVNKKGAPVVREPLLFD